MRLYLYCLSDDLSAGAIETAVGIAGAGIAGAAPRLVDLGAIKAVVSDVDAPVKVTKENVIAHQRVIDRVLAETTPLPFRFGVVVAPAELQSYVASNEARLYGLLDRVRGAVEMNVKIIWDLKALRLDRSIEATSEVSGGAGPGLRFLLAKQQEMARERELKSKAEEIASWLDRSVEGLVREKAVSVNPTDNLVVKAAFLVERERLADYRERVNSFSSERNELRFLTSGAWPPYSFTHLRS